MSYPAYGFDGQMNLCYLYMKQLQNCFKEKIYPRTSCKHEQEDFLECHSNTKTRETNAKIEKAFREKNVRVPYYNIDKDEFIFQDGQRVPNDDPVFKQYKWL